MDRNDSDIYCLFFPPSKADRRQFAVDSASHRRCPHDLDEPNGEQRVLPQIQTTCNWHTSPAEFITPSHRAKTLTTAGRHVANVLKTQEQGHEGKTLEDNGALRKNRATIYTLQAVEQCPWIGVPFRDGTLAVSSRHVSLFTGMSRSSLQSGLRPHWGADLSHR